jgi:hypothetical protein
MSRKDLSINRNPKYPYLENKHDQPSIKRNKLDDFKLKYPDSDYKLKTISPFR